MKKRYYIGVACLVGLLLTGCSNQQKDTDEKKGEQSNSYSVSTVSQTEFGKVKGIKEDHTYIWYGIPYGADTSGENRWHAPKDPEKWVDTLDCTKPGEVALQSGSKGVTGSENALNLDVYRPDNSKDKLPVLVYIHGGNNQTGQAQEISGQSFVKSHDAIYVSVNYRLGVLGFNPLPALQKGTDEEKSGNYTLLDIKHSLDWIKENISNFGGDAENITVSGFSAGGRDVMAMLISPIFKGSFQKAISFSGGMTTAPVEQSQQVFAKAFAPLVVEDKVQPDESSAVNWLLSDDAKVRDYLYQLSGERLAKLMGNAGIRMAVFPHLYTDGVVLPKEGFDTKNYNDVPLMMTTGQTEFSLFGRFDPYFAKNVADQSIDKDANVKAQYDFINKYGGKLYSLFNVTDSANKMKTNYQSPIYGMEFTFGNDVSVVGNKMGVFGSFHGVFVPLLDTNSQNYTALVGDAYQSKGAKQLATTFQDYVYRFISTGNPNGKGLEKWSDWQENQDILILGATKDKVTANQEPKSYTYDDVLAEMKADQTLDSATKEKLIKQVLNGRWFSHQLDKENNNLSDFYTK